jgi:hypothetical protein
LLISADFFIQQKWLAEIELSFLRKAFANVKSYMNYGKITYATAGCADSKTPWLQNL